MRLDCDALVFVRFDCYIWVLLYVAFCTIMAISRQKEARSRYYALLLFWMTSRVLYSAQYHRQHCTLHAFEQVTSPSRYEWAIGAGLDCYRNNSFQFRTSFPSFELLQGCAIQTFDNFGALNRQQINFDFLYEWCTRMCIQFENTSYLHIYLHKLCGYTKEKTATHDQEFTVNKLSVCTTYSQWQNVTFY